MDAAGLSDLYQSLILDHNARPRNFHAMADADRTADGRNPLCGDELTVWLKLDGDVIADASFIGKGCAISKASASLMTVAVQGKTKAEVEVLFDRFHDMVTGKTVPAERDPELGRLAAFAGVARYPVRVKCASLSWHAMRSALHAET